MGIIASGIGSGLDINGLVSQLVSTESRQLNQIKAQDKAISAKISAYGQLTSAVAAFQSAVKSLSNSGLTGMTAASSVQEALSATTAGGAAPGNYRIVVNQLAQAQRLLSPGFADSSTALGAGTLSLQAGSGAAVMLTPKDNTLQGLADAINASGLGVSASLIRDGSVNGAHLAISSQQTGSASTIRLTGTGALAAFSFDPAAAVSFAYDAQGNPPVVMSQTVAAQDAQLTIDGMKVTSASNSVSSAIQGVTLQLAQASDAPVTLSISRDTTATKTAISNVAKTWNELRSLVVTQTAWNEATRKGAALNGDFEPSQVMTRLRSAMAATVAVAGSQIDTLSDIGISFQKDGSMSIADSKLSAAMTTDFAGLRGLFAGSDGIATRLAGLTDTLLGDGGLLKNRTEGLATHQRRLGQRETAEQARLEAIERRYRAQFTRLDSTLSRMQGASSYLAQQLAALPKA